ncbi:MAG: Dabb family protein [Nocardioidaceae bacterium]
MTLQHIVLFKYRDELSEADAAQMRAQIAAWPASIDGIRKLRFGRDVTQERTRGHQYLLYTEFDDLDAMRAYQQHPLHQHFLAWVLERDCVPLAFDYQLDEQTVIVE